MTHTTGLGVGSAGSRHRTVIGGGAECQERESGRCLGNPSARHLQRPAIMCHPWLILDAPWQSIFSEAREPTSRFKSAQPSGLEFPPWLGFFVQSSLPQQYIYGGKAPILANINSTSALLHFWSSQWSIKVECA